MEALARGAVRFSRRYTLEELRARWQAILFDNDTSESASHRILEVDGDSGIPTKPRRNPSLKKNTESLRSQYNTARKKICNRPSNFQGYDFDMSIANDLPVENGHCGDEEMRPSEQLFEYCFPENQFHVDYNIPEAGDPKHIASFPDMLGIDNESIDVNGGTSSALCVSIIETDFIFFLNSMTFFLFTLQIIWSHLKVDLKMMFFVEITYMNTLMMHFRCLQKKCQRE